MDLDFEGIVNARDLGGLPAGGLKVRPGCLLRTAYLAEATDADIERLQRMKLRAVFDFRSLPEAVAAPDRQVPGAIIWALVGVAMVLALELLTKKKES